MYIKRSLSNILHSSWPNHNDGAYSNYTHSHTFFSSKPIREHTYFIGGSINPHVVTDYYFCADWKHLSSHTTWAFIIFLRDCYTTQLAHWSIIIPSNCTVLVNSSEWLAAASKVYRSSSSFVCLFEVVKTACSHTYELFNGKHLWAQD